MGLIQVILQLQDADQEWDKKAKLYQSVRQRLSDQSELEAERKAQRDRVQELSSTRGTLRDAELELAALQEKADRIEKDLYGGRITSSRELENLRQDGEHIQRRLSEIEDRVLIGMTKVDDLEAATTQGEKKLQAFEMQWAKERELLVDQYKKLRARLQQLQKSREQLRGRLGRAELALYDELRAKKGGIALSPAKDGVCQLCHVKLPSYKSELMETGETVVTCDGCGRILYPQ